MLSRCTVGIWRVHFFSPNLLHLRRETRVSLHLLVRWFYTHLLPTDNTVNALHKPTSKPPSILPHLTPCNVTLAVHYPYFLPSSSRYHIAPHRATPRVSHLIPMLRSTHTTTTITSHRIVINIYQTLPYVHTLRTLTAYPTPCRAVIIPVIVVVVGYVTTRHRDPGPTKAT